MTNTFITARSWRYKSERKNYHVMWNGRRCRCRCRRCCCCRHHHHHHWTISANIEFWWIFNKKRCAGTHSLTHMQTYSNNHSIHSTRFFFLLSFNLSFSLFFSLANHSNQIPVLNGKTTCCLFNFRL